MRQAVDGAPVLEQRGERLAVGGQRPPAVRRHAIHDPAERRVEPDRHAVGQDVGAVGGLDERAAAGGDDDVARGQEGQQDLAFDLAEIRLAVLGEHLRHRPALAPLDLLVQVDDPPAEPPAERPRKRGLARPHEADEVDLVGGAATSFPQRGEDVEEARDRTR